MSGIVDVDDVRPIIWQDDSLYLLDQRHLPERLEIRRYRHGDEVAAAIGGMVVRGAPAIGITAAYGVVLAARDRYRSNPDTWRRAIREDLEKIGAARPTAINLSWALARMRAAFPTDGNDPESVLLAEAKRIHEEDILANRMIGHLGAQLIPAPCRVLTHCNAGALATGGYGTALGVIRSAFAQGKIAHVFVDETRPWLQGARLTAWELHREGIPFQLLADGAAAYAMAEEKVAWVIVGADRIAPNGDVANKIGTYALAIAARHHRIGFMVAAPTSTIDYNPKQSLPSPGNSDAIPIEMRSEDELLYVGGQRIAPPNARAWNPVFDVTPAALIDAIVTEAGVVTTPDTPKIAALMASIEQSPSFG